jgi:hypothetical protein
VNNWVTIKLDPDTPDRTRDILASLPRVKVSRGRRPTITLKGAERPLVILQGIAPYAHVMAPLLAEVNGPQRVPMVIAERLTRGVRASLEQAGCSYADGTGAVHIEAPDFLLHVDHDRDRNEGAIAPPRGLGAVGVRVIQVVLSDPERDWGVADLAEASGASTGQSHNVLLRLENEGHVRATGAGPARRRRVVQPGDLLDWLVRVPAARKLHAKLNAYVYAPDVDALIARLSHSAQESGITWALTGAAGARVMGVTAVTSLPVAMVRVSPKPGLRAAAAALGAEPVNAGANLLLVSDVGDVGTRDVIRNGPVALAPPVRIWLDMQSEPRGEDAAALFREAVLDY